MKTIRESTEEPIREGSRPRTLLPTMANTDESTKRQEGCKKRKHLRGRDRISEQKEERKGQERARRDLVDGAGGTRKNVSKTGEVVFRKRKGRQDLTRALHRVNPELRSRHTRGGAKTGQTVPLPEENPQANRTKPVGREDE